ncbi:MAG: vanadium-dependent haloperoxidase [Saprospiraceae bacterium]
MKSNQLARLLLLFIAILWALPGCRKDSVVPVPQPVLPETDQFTSDLAVQWFNKLYTLTKTCPGFSPPVASRAFGYAGVALYESVVHGMPAYRSLGGKLSAMPKMPAPNPDEEYYWPSCANAAMAYMAKNLYANMPADQLASVEALEKQFEQASLAAVDSATHARSVEYGRQVADAVFFWSTGDGGHTGYTKNFPTTFVAPVGPGKWVPTAPAFQRALQPYWGYNREFVPGSINHSQPVPPPAFSTDPASEFYKQGQEVYTVTTNLTAEQVRIAKYWSDDPGLAGTPPGHSISIATQILIEKNANLALAAETYCKVGMAVADAFITCWRCKYVFNLMRPITYIHDNFDPAWVPLLTTPPFPEYTSGHSVQSGATAQVLSDMFGYQNAFTDRTHLQRTDIDGSPRSFSSFFDYANEAAISRLYGGIHFRDAIYVGIDQGRKIGESIKALPFRK